MLNNYIKISFRNLKKNKGFTGINIIGLAIGMAAAILILLWVRSEMTYNRTFAKTDQLYIVGNKDKWNGNIEVYFMTPKPMAEAIKTDFPELKKITRVSPVDNFTFQIGDNNIKSGSGIFADSTFLSMFNPSIIEGGSKFALRNSSEIILTETFAQNLFGTTDVVGKLINIDDTEAVSVSAVVEDFPVNSSFNTFKYILPWTFLEKIGKSDDNWHNNSIYTYIETAPSADISSIQARFTGFSKKHKETQTDNFIKPIGDIWLYGKYKDGEVVGGRIEMVRIFTVIASFILIIACINFMNLSTAQSEKRAKEVGVRKVVGAKKSSLIYLFLTESAIVSLAAGIIALLIVFVSLPFYSTLIDRKLDFEFTNPIYWIIFIGFVLVTGLMAGSYPAFFLSSFQPIKVLKGKLSHVVSKFNPRKFLVVCQFSIAIILIISTLVINKQIQYGENRKIGYNKENLIFITENEQIRSKIGSIKEELINQGIASSVTRTMTALTTNWSTGDSFEWEGKDLNNKISFNRFTADEHIVHTAGLKLITGRDFDLTKFPTDSTGVIINESAAKIIGLTDPIGKSIQDMGINWHIVGVIEDFVQESPFDPIAPLIIEGAKGIETFSQIIPNNTLHIKFNSSMSTSEALNKTEKIFKLFNPNSPFEYNFIDEDYAKKFDEFQRLEKLSTLFSILTIFISCLGLFGLSAFMAESRTKEIGVRKVLGASVFSVTKLLSKEFLILVGVSCLIAFPIAYWTMNKYLSGYSYRITLSWEIFATTAILAIVVTLLTIGYQSIKAALANPVTSLRDE